VQLFEPVRIGGKESRNRIVITSHLFSPHSWDVDESGDKYAAYIARRTAGVGMFGLSGIFVRPVSEERPFPFSHLAPRLRRYAKIGHDNGSLVVVQLQADGASHRSGFDSNLPWDGEPLFAFDAARPPRAPEMTHRMSGAEIESLVEGYAQLARLVVECGLDGIELHGGHGYLLQQSFSPWLNHRDDEWGQPLYFWKAVLTRVRELIGREPIVGARIPSDDLRSPEDGGLGKEKLRALAVELADTELLDYLNPTHGSGASSYPVIVGTYRRPHGEFLPDAAAIRAAIAQRIPVIGVGRITSAEHAEAALANGECDLVGLTRAHIADPDFTRKLAAGQAHRIRPCVGANVGCIDRNAMLGDVMCFHNPEVGREYRPQTMPVTAAKPARVLVVGAGPAGLKAAEVAARRGHEVIVVERSGSVGGRLAMITEITAAHELTKSVRWLEAELGHLGVDVRLNVTADATLFRTLAPDAIVLATGSTPSTPSFATDGSVPLLSTDEAMTLIGREPDGKGVLVYDRHSGDEAAVVVEQLAARGYEVTVVTPGSLGASMGYTHVLDHIPRLLGMGCHIEERTEIASIASGGVETRNLLSGATETRRFDHVVLADTRVADDSLESAARQFTADIRMAGDALAPRDAMLAIFTGNEAGRLTAQ
jgi:2,4-dienoyl-CoA reductase-like NADH-dependent reductase (Old Yellow Enzyme family)